MAKNIWQDPTSQIPKGNNPMIDRVQFDESQVGARKSHLPKSGEVKNDLGIKHVGGKG